MLKKHDFPKKIAFIHGDSNVIAGSELSLLQIMKKIDHSLFYPILITTRKEIFTELVKKNNIEVKIIPLHRFNKKHPLRFIKTIFSLLAYFFNNRISLIHVNNIYPCQYSVIVSKIARKPIVCHPRTTGYYKYGVDSSLVKYVDRVICISEGVEHTMLQLGIKKEQINRVTNGVNLKEFDTALKYENIFRKEYNIPDDCTLIGQFGQIIERKGIKDFLDMTRIVTNKCKNVRFILVGDQHYDEGAYRKQMEQYCKDIGMEKHVIFTGFRTDVYQVMSETDIHVLASDIEGLSCVLIEAASLKKPIVATNILGNNEAIIDGVTGLLTPVSDPNSLANKIILLVNDKGLSKKLGENARKRVATYFNQETELKTIQDIYFDLLRIKS